MRLCRKTRTVLFRAAARVTVVHNMNGWLLVSDCIIGTWKNDMAFVFLELKNGIVGLMELINKIKVSI